MTKTTKTLLMISLTSFVISSTGILWGLFLPIGAICFGLFMIATVLSKEMALFDQEERTRIARAENQKTSSHAADKTEHAHDHVLVASTSH